MTNIIPFSPPVRVRPGAPTMSSHEIADLVEKRHDNVKRTIEMLAERGTIPFPQFEEKPTAGRPVVVYHLDKRSSLIIVAQLSPEFTARIVDRWQALEEERKAVVPTLPDFTNPAEAARAWADQVEAVQLLERERHQARALIAVQTPLVEAHRILSETPGSMGLREAAKYLGAEQRKLIRWLSLNGWIYRSSGRSPRWVAYADKVKAGLMEEVARSIDNGVANFVTGQARITAKGLTRLAEIQARQRKGAA